MECIMPRTKEPIALTPELVALVDRIEPDPGPEPGRHDPTDDEFDSMARDVLAGRDFAWAVHQYDGGHGLSHRVRAYALNAAGIPERIEISRHSFPRYGLKLTLLQAERLSADDPRLRP